MGVEGLRFVITGAGAGIGEATARVAASKGARVMLADVNAENAARVAAEIRAAGGLAGHAHCDVTDPEQVKALMAATAAAFGGIDVLHNNAGIHETALVAPEKCSIEEMSVEVFRKVIDVNTVGPWLCTKFALPYLKQSGKASVINAGSTGSQSAYPKCMAYGASKGGIRLLTQNLAVELAPYGIRVNCYGPTAIATNMVREYIKQAPDPAVLEKSLISTSLIPRLGRPEEVAELVCFLASPQSAFINGTFILIDGGSLAWRGTVDVLGM
jgi:NAD(P)-dependent dehydrogenase (short-subunit alcohol dehydrogenase family)